MMVWVLCSFYACVSTPPELHRPDGTWVEENSVWNQCEVMKEASEGIEGITFNQCIPLSEWLRIGYEDR